MGFNNKIFRAEMYGYQRAYELAKEKGFEELEKDVKRRNVMAAPVQYTDTQIKEFWSTLTKNLFQNFLVSCSYTLVDSFGFGKKRLGDFHSALKSNIDALMDLDYMGESYVSLLDYAEEIKKKASFDIDIARISACDDLAKERDNNYHYMKVESACEDLKRAGFEDAANYLMEKVK